MWRLKLHLRGLHLRRLKLDLRRLKLWLRHLRLRWLDWNLRRRGSLHPRRVEHPGEVSGTLRNRGN